MLQFCEVPGPVDPYIVANINTTATAMTTVADQPKKRWRMLMVNFPIKRSD